MLRISDMKIEVISSVLQYAEEKLEQDLEQLKQVSEEITSQLSKVAKQV